MRIEQKARRPNARKPDWESVHGTPDASAVMTLNARCPSARCRGMSLRCVRKREPTTTSARPVEDRGDHVADLVRVVLAVAIDEDESIGTLLDRVAEEGRNGGTLPTVVPMADHRGAGVQRVPRRPIPGAVVDDDDGRGVRQCASDHVRDLVLFVERGDPHDDFRIEELRHGCGLPLINVMAANHRGRRICSTGPILAPRPHSGGRASDEQFDRDLDR